MFLIFLAFSLLFVEYSSSEFPCPPGEIHSGDKCADLCVPTCQTPGPGHVYGYPLMVSCRLDCIIGCYCAPGLIRDEISGRCVSECP
ncbi:cysteine-rich venom protein 1-like [Coccinella septempunctata]|uniref:cysteine-rich venom protein 1-like n=1 Tax=Coccinella septempunctata TaxID=41139 RepID=UPI001D086AB9|nr:cysteine-rich venom protein 1-like [Coccinella septempunctata]